MRQSLKNLLSNAVALSYTLPKVGIIPKVKISSEPDDCLTVKTTDQDIAKIVYNGIVEYSFDNLDSYWGRLDDAQIIALRTKLHFDPAASQDARIKYGFYGEVLLYLFLQHFHNADTVISRGWFYLPTENSETKGYDTYQMVECSDGTIELWFGELKFYQDYKGAIKKILDKISVSLSDEYLERNVVTISQSVINVNPRSHIDSIINDWLNNPKIVIANEVAKHNMTLVYPMLVVFDDNDCSYDEIIKEVVDYVNTNYPSVKYSMKIPVKLFFMFLPVGSAKVVKTQVLSWIDTNAALI